jgi:anaerobic dimethyl sulfoxide reductase subunit C (anchor subunit)
MNVREWSLVVFTILGQMSVGAFLVFLVVYFAAVRKAGRVEAERLSDLALLAIGPVLLLGMAASVLHLGNITNAYRAVANLGQSWLSREIFFGVLFAVVGGIFGIMQWRKFGPFALRIVIAILAAILGIGLVVSMSAVYLLANAPSWDTWGTPVSFAVTTLLLGVLAMGAAFVANYAYLQRQDPSCAEAQCTLLRSTLRWLAVAGVVLLGAELVVIPLQIGYLAATGSAAGLASIKMLLGEFGLIMGLRLALVFLGAGVLGVFIYQNSLTPGQESALATLAYSAFTLVLVAEILGRYLFYATHVAAGL